MLYGVRHIEEAQIMRKMTIVGLWCIQVNPLNRPYINEIIKMLEGHANALHIPPRPFYSSPERPPSPTNDSII